MKRTWEIATVTDAARARIATARLAAAYGVAVLDRTRLTTSLSAQLRQCLTKDGTWRLTLDVVTGEAGPGALHLSLTARDPAESAAHPPWRASAVCREPSAAAAGSTPPDAATELAESLLGADEDTALVLEKLSDQEELVAFHREELHQTNQGVVALHAELDAAGRAQREAFAAERKARTEAESARRRLTFLANASAVLTSSLNHDEIVRRLPELLVPEYARSVDVWLFDGDAEQAPPTPHPAAAVVAARTGRPQYAARRPGGLPGVDDQPPSALEPELPLLCIPLPTRRAPLGVLTLAPTAGDGWDPDDVVMLIEIARRASIAIDNARRFEHNRDIAETLQRALLTDLPVTPGLRLAARYLPATHGLNIGGDWYDAFRQPDGGLIAVIGDVTGHGLHAAVMMSQLRTALRAYAVDGGSPGTLLTRLHTFLHHLQPDLYATAVIARFHPDETTLTWAAAGHPPPVLRTPDGQVHTLDAKPSAMLGIPLSQQIHDHTMEMPPGSTLALYTDGLVERRALGIDPGIERLARALGSLGTAQLEQDLDGSADRILDPMLGDSERDDDICLLLCHIAADGA
ncbi:PP2C family protein-serine/threonine phosphatase [Streptomyces spinosirectus]